MKSKFNIGNKVIGGSQTPLYFIADIGANHDGDINRAFSLIELAKEAGANAAKFQNFKAQKIVSAKGFQDLGSQLSHQAKWKKSVFEIYQDASLQDDWTHLLKAKCDEVGIDYFTSAYDFDAVDHAEPFVDVFKIGSGDITWTEILKTYCFQKNKPILLATGASDIEDVRRAVRTIEDFPVELCLMQCNTNYTVSKDKIKYVNLRVLETYKNMFPNCALGLSDHTFGHATVLGAIAFGAIVFEKHFTDDNDREGPDHKFAMNPKTWMEMVNTAYELYYSLGDGIKRVEDNELQAKVVQQRSLRATRDLFEGHVISEFDLEPLRPKPENGFAPYELELLLGKKIARPLNKGEHITERHLV